MYMGLHGGFSVLQAWYYIYGITWDLWWTHPDGIMSPCLYQSYRTSTQDRAERKQCWTSDSTHCRIQWPCKVCHVTNTLVRITVDPLRYGHNIMIVLSSRMIFNVPDNYWFPNSSNTFWTSKRGQPLQRTRQLIYIVTNVSFIRRFHCTLKMILHDCT